jgi:DnaJ-class molecular chaperone
MLQRQEKTRPCPFCSSTGSIEGPMGGPTATSCPVCKGRRHNQIPGDWLKCAECGGTGEFTFGAGKANFRKPCPECEGSGWRPK